MSSRTAPAKVWTSLGTGRSLHEMHPSSRDHGTYFRECLGSARGLPGVGQSVCSSAGFLPGKKILLHTIPAFVHWPLGNLGGGGAGRKHSVVLFPFRESPFDSSQPLMEVGCQGYWLKELFVHTAW